MGLSWKSMWNYKCPRCRQGDLYIAPLRISDPLRMNGHCDACGQSFEPGAHFYQGAMFIGYGIAIWSYILPGLFFVFVLKWSFAVAMIICVIQFLVMIIWIIRFSRSMWIHFAVKYDPQKAKEALKQQMT